MRILAIRGKDLASIVGEFAVRLEVDPLSTSGVFAITGKTGAGKSTVLDALCLALFDATPRLDAKGGALVGDADDPHKLAANDVRNLVRKGAGSAYAEVDFVGVDDLVYRARWEARRAHGRADGAFQIPKLALTRRDTGEHIADGKKAVKEAIVEKLGLTFEQARRSLLLAQNEFARFLSATGDERARLLEQITGTGIYTELSCAAFERARAARSRLDALRESVGRDAPLDDDARGVLEVEHAERKQAADATSTELTRLEAAGRWRDRQANLRKGVQESTEELEAAEHAVEASTALREELARVRHAEKLRPAYESGTRSLGVERTAAERLEQANAAAKQARGELEHHTPLVEAARARVAQATQALEAARPLLTRAREVGAQLGPASLAVSKARLHADGIARRGLALAHEYAALPGHVADAEHALTEACAWLANYAEHERLATRWDWVSAELDQLRVAAASEREVEIDHARLAGQCFRFAELEHDAGRAHAGARAEVDALERALGESLRRRDEVRAD